MNNELNTPVYLSQDTIKLLQQIEPFNIDEIVRKIAKFYIANNKDTTKQQNT